MAHGLLSTNLNLMLPLTPGALGQSIALKCVFQLSEPGAYKSNPTKTMRSFIYLFIFLNLFLP